MMLTQSKSQIYKSQLRGRIEENGYKCLATFNYAEYFDESRKPFGTVSIINDETLGPKKSIHYLNRETETILVIPLVGSVKYIPKNKDVDIIETEQIVIINTESKASFELQNPYEEALINFLQIRLKTSNSKDLHFNKKSFTINHHGILNQIYESAAVKVFIGGFDAGQEGKLELDATKKGVLCFVINGCFEFQNRLLESRDSLAIWNEETIEWEALTPDGILLIIETPI